MAAGRWRLRSINLNKHALSQSDDRLRSSIILARMHGVARGASSLSGTGDRAAQAERVRRALHGLDAEGDMLLERDAQLFGAAADVVAIHAARKGFVLQLALHGVRFDFQDTLARFDERAGRQEAGQLVAGEECALERPRPP